MTIPRDREAMEKAKEVFRKVWRGQFVPDNQWQSAMISMIAQALLDFAEEAVKQSWANELTATAVVAERYEIMRKAKAEEAIAQIKQEAHASGYAEAVATFAIDKASFDMGYAQARENAAKFVETYREKQVADLKTYYAEDRELANKIRALPTGVKDV